MIEDYAALESLVSSLTDKHALLLTIAEMFSSVGMCSQAVAAFIKVIANFRIRKSNTGHHDNFIKSINCILKKKKNQVLLLCAVWAPYCAYHSFKGEIFYLLCPILVYYFITL